MPPILLLKTKSSPHDGYDDFFSANDYTPSFIPVLEHRFHTENLAHVRELFASGAFDSNASDNPNGPKYGGIIFTSQRAVEGFAEMIDQHGLPLNPSTNLPLYTVGPATARSLTTLRNKHLPSCSIHGEDTGTGEKLAHHMLQHYNTLHPAADPNPSLLFLVGEQRRDIIPKTLMDPSLPDDQRIPVEEIVVYETGEMGSFEGDFRSAVQGSGEGVLWVVVFSPSGCEAMLRVLGLGPFAGNGNGNGNGNGDERKVFVATIGPTTRDHLRSKFGFEPHLCAEKPSPEGVGEGIRRFMEEQGL